MRHGSILILVEILVIVFDDSLSIFGVIQIGQLEEIISIMKEFGIETLVTTINTFNEEYK